MSLFQRRTPCSKSSWLRRCGVLVVESLVLLVVLVVAVAGEQQVHLSVDGTASTATTSSTNQLLSSLWESFLASLHQSPKQSNKDTDRNADEETHPVQIKPTRRRGLLELSLKSHYTSLFLADHDPPEPHPQHIDSEGCVIYKESYYWAFRWCPGASLEQGRILLEHDQTHFVEHFDMGEWVPGNKMVSPDGLKQQAAQLIRSTSQEQQHRLGRYLESFHNGDVCETTSDNTQRRQALVVVDELTNCPAAYWIQSIQEPETCQYLIHACKSSSMDDVSQTDEEPHKVQALNQTLTRITQLLHTYLYQSAVETKRKHQPDRTTSLHLGLPPFPPSRIQTNLELIRDMFTHSYDSYMYHAYPASEIKPITCEPGVFHLVRLPALTLMDSLDMLLVLGNYTEFARSVERLRLLNQQRQGLFSVNQNVSVFETNIRVLGGLLSAHQMANAFLDQQVVLPHVWDEETGDILMGTTPSSLSNQTLGYYVYDGFLLDLAQDLGNRLLAAFDTKTGIPFGTVNLLYGIPNDETKIASLAGGGTLSLEMELLSRLTGDDSYGKAAKLASRALWMRRSQIHLLGKHIDIESGEWTESLSGIGSNSDSFYEYLIKHYTLFPEDQDFWMMMIAAYSGVHNDTRLGEWYADVDMHLGTQKGASRRVFESLMAFYPGMQVLLGDVTPAARSLNGFFMVREYLGFLPERFHYGNWKIDGGTFGGGGRHPLRPELLESCYFLHRATKGLCNHRQSSLDYSGWMWAADFSLHALEKVTKSKCGYSGLKEMSAKTTGTPGASQGTKEFHYMNEMPSFFLSETLKYLYLTFDQDNLLHTDHEREWVFTTEAHPIHNVPIPTNEENSKFEQMKASLKQHLEQRQSNLVSEDPIQSEELYKDELWTEGTSLEAYRESVNQTYTTTYSSAQQRMGERVAPSEHVAGFFDWSRMIEPFQLPEDTLDAEINVAHLSLGNLGFGHNISIKACPNIYATNLLWMHALNGGVLDYADCYVSVASDDLVGESHFVALSAVDAIAYHGSGAYLGMAFAPNEVCAVDKDSEESSSMPNYRSRFDGGKDLGAFEISTFPEGSGFFLMHVESGETLVTTLVHDGVDDKLTASYIMTFATMPVATNEVATSTSDEGSLASSWRRVGRSWSSMFKRHEQEDEEASSLEGLPERSVIMSDFSGHSYVCEVEVLRRLLPEEHLIYDPSDDNVSSGSEDVVVGKYPCAPALFGPTHMENLLETEDGVTAEAVLRLPVISDEYGCESSEPNSEVPRVNEALIPSIIHTSGNEQAVEESFTGHTTSEDDDDSELLTDASKGSVVQLVHRGVCTFQSKAVNQKKRRNAEAVIVVNNEEDELFVMSHGLEEEEDSSAEIPVTVLVTGSDGTRLEELIHGLDNSHGNCLVARVSVRPQRGRADSTGKIHKTGGGIDWPLVRASTTSIQSFSKRGWGVHAVERQASGEDSKQEWQLFLLRHQGAP